MRRFLANVTEYPPAQLSRLLVCQGRTGRRGGGGRWSVIQDPALLLAELNEAFGQLSGSDTEYIFRRQHEVFGGTASRA